MPNTGHYNVSYRTPHKKHTRLFLKTYFNTVNLPISLHNNINDRGCIRYCWILHNGHFPWGGPPIFQAVYHPRKSTFKTHPKRVFFRFDNRP